MRHMYFLLSYLLTYLTVSAAESVQPRQETVTDDSAYMTLVPRAAPNRSRSKERFSRETLSGSPPPRERSSRETSSGSSSSRESSPDLLSNRRIVSLVRTSDSPTRSRSPPPRRLPLPRDHKLSAENPLGMENGPIKVRRYKLPSRAGRVKSDQETRPESPPPLRGAISGHPTSAMVLMKGPGFMQAQTSSGHTEVARVHPGKWDFISVQDHQGGFALGRTDPGGLAVAAATGNAVAGYVASHHTAEGFVETHNGFSTSYYAVPPGEEYRKHVRGDGTGEPKGSAVAQIHGRGQVTAVGMVRESEQVPNKYADPFE